MRVLTGGARTWRLFAACAQPRNLYLSAIVTLAVNTGMRKSETVDLTWERVDLTKDMGFEARIVLYQTKSGKPRGIPLNTASVAALTSLMPNPAERGGRVFARQDGAEWGSIRTGFERAVERAGLADFRFHDLRHTAASHMVIRGRPLRQVADVLGHSSIAMTMRYSHLSPSHFPQRWKPWMDSHQFCAWLSGWRKNWHNRPHMPNRARPRRAN